MALGQASVINQNQGQGDFTQVENQCLFIGTGTKNIGKIVYLSGDSDLDNDLGVADSAIKTMVSAARSNAGNNWTAVAIPIPVANPGDWRPAFDNAMAENVVCEMVAICDPIENAAAITEMHDVAIAVQNSLGRRVTFQCATRAIDPSAATNNTWSEYITEVSALTQGLSAYRVGVVASVVPDFLGMYIGRLCNKNVSIADSPMRVKTGALVGVSALPVDSDDVKYSNAHAKALNDARFTVPQTYADFPGVFCSDGQLLDAPGGDYQVIENLRVVDAAARRVRLLAIQRIGDRQLNSTPISIQSSSTYFMRPLIDMSRATIINGQQYPGELLPPEDGDIKIQWVSRTAVNIYIQARPYNNPKKIGVAIALDLANNAIS